MIEVEKNFDLRPGDKERLIRGAEFVRRKIFTDVYYDRPDYFLTRRDLWLRARDGKFELKTPLFQGGIGERKTDRYRELEADEEIARELNLKIKTKLEDALREEGYAPFAKITTSRETYRRDNFRLDFDETDFGFTTFEVELMIEDGEDPRAAEAEILEFAREHGISGTEARGKVIEYIFRNRPEHYAALVASGVVKDVKSEKK
jgi:predicted adenylyl cyclase CyaB